MDELPQFVGECETAGGFKEFGIKSWDWQDCYNEQINCWSYLLIKHPEWADRCDKFKGWVDFQAKDWVALLKKHPCFADRCNTADGWKSFKNHNWVNLLQQQPQFAVQCGSYNCWQNFNGFDWVELLRERPEFADKCERFGGWREIDFSAITTKYRDDYVVHGKMPGDKGQSVAVSRIVGEMSASVDTIPCEKEYTYFDSEGKELLRTDYAPPFCGRWAELLEKQPQFATKCDEYNGWEAFDGFDWYLLLSAQPSFVSKCNALEGWDKLFRYRPTLHSYLDGCEEHIHQQLYANEYDMYVLPEEYDATFSREKRLPASDCTKGLPVNCWIEGFFGEEFNLEGLKGTQLVTGLTKCFWMCFLSQEPSMAVAASKDFGVESVWSTLTNDEWRVAIKDKAAVIPFIAADYLWSDQFFDAILKSWPDFFDNLGPFTSYDDNGVKCQGWPNIIRHRPELASHMNWNDWKRLEGKDWDRLLDPKWHYIERAITTIDETFWYLCLSKAPKYADLCNKHDGWRKISNSHLCDLMLTHSELKEYCIRNLKWNQLTANDWLRLISQQQESEYFIRECDKHKGWKRFATRINEWSCLLWVDLLKERPQLVCKCNAYNGWQEFNGNDWQNWVAD